MKLSIITVNFNNKIGLQKTMDSVLKQIVKDFEWIIVDGASTDGSKELIELHDKYISYWVSEPDKGIYNAMNKGVMMANGEFLLFLNSGDYLYGDVLCKVLPLLTDKDFYVGDALHAYKNCLWKPNISTIDDLYRTLVYVTFPHQATFIRRDVFTTFGLYREDKKIISDWWLCYTALILNKATIDKIPFVVSVFEGNGISDRQPEIIEKEKTELLSESSRLIFFYDFYKSNYEFIEALKGTRWFFFIFRVYFYFYRKLGNK